MDPVDFNSGQLSTDANLCLGAIFVYPIDTLDGFTTWLIGDSFLKNVYSVYRFSPNPAIGFSILSSNFTSVNNNPSASSEYSANSTTPAVAATTTATPSTVTTSTPKSAASLSTGLGSISLTIVCSVGGVLILIL